MTEPDDLQTRQGYLLLADISGYTTFLTGTELEHAHAIITELTKLIRQRLAPPMRFVKLEGDAVFCYADTDAFKKGERFLELVEVCYFDFTNRLLDMARSTTCRCNACAAIPTLGLKFVTHFGSFIVEHDEGREDLSGPDVILVHRLLKNSISEGDGPQAYAFFTEACMNRLPDGFELPKHSEEYESFGETTGGVHDLQPVAAARREARREYIIPEDADLDVTMEVSAPPSVVWQYFVDPEKRLRWQRMQTDVTVQYNEKGRLGVGASSHCVHGTGVADGLREYLDWRPFDYFTDHYSSFPNGTEALVPAVETMEFRETEAGSTTVTLRIRIDDRSPAAIASFKEQSKAIEMGFPTVGAKMLMDAVNEDFGAFGLDQADA